MHYIQSNSEGPTLRYPNVYLESVAAFFILLININTFCAY